MESEGLGLINAVRRMEPEKQLLSRTSPGGLGRLIDHVYLSSSMADTLGGVYVDWKDIAGEVRLSDHYAVGAEFDLRPEGGDDLAAPVLPPPAPGVSAPAQPTHKFGEITKIRMTTDGTPVAWGERYNQNGSRHQATFDLLTATCKSRPAIQALQGAQAATDELDCTLCPQGPCPVGVRTRDAPARVALSAAANAFFAAVESALPSSLIMKPETAAKKQEQRWRQMFSVEKGYDQFHSATPAGKWSQVEKSITSVGNKARTLLRMRDAASDPTRPDDARAAEIRKDLITLTTRAATLAASATTEEDNALAGMDRDIQDREYDRAKHGTGSQGRQGEVGLEGGCLDEEEETGDSLGVSAEMAEILQTMVDEELRQAHPASKYADWHPDMACQGRIEEALADSTGDAHDVQGGLLSYLGALASWARHAARAAKRRAVRCSVAARAHQFRMGHFGEYARLIKMRPGKVAPAPHDVYTATRADGTKYQQKARSDAERLRATEEYQQAYFRKQNELPMAVRHDDAGVAMYTLQEQYTREDASRDATALLARRDTGTPGPAKEDKEDEGRGLDMLKETTSAYMEVYKILVPKTLTDRQLTAMEWPFQVGRDPTGRIQFSHDHVLAEMRQGMYGQPKKARHMGFHMHVIGRLPAAYMAIALRLLRACLALRMMPDMARAITLISIPKPDGGFRPLALTHDLYAMLTNTIAKHMQTGTERAGLLRNCINAYRPGRSGTHLAATQQCAIEDSRQHNKPLYILLEDWQKFYDSISVEVIVLALRAAGLSSQGYAQWAAEALHERDIHVVTSAGTTGPVKREAGFMQGSSFSCVCVNYVVQLLHDMWMANERGEGYTFNDASGTTVTSLSYCDDNNRLAGSLADITEAVVQSGYLSAVLGIGRSTKQAKVLAFNTGEHDTTASSHDQEYIAKHLVTRVVDGEPIQYVRGIAHDRQARQGLGDLCWAELPVIRDCQPYKYLGLREHMQAGDKSHQNAMGKGAMARLQLLMKKSTTISELAWLYNAGVIPIVTWMALLGGTMPKHAMELDSQATAAVRSRSALGRADPAHSLWAPRGGKYGGMGMQSATKRLAQEKAGSLDMILNDSTAVCHGPALQRLESARAMATGLWGQIAAQPAGQRRHGIPEADKTIGGRGNFIYAGIRSLAELGIYMRDRKDDELVSRILDILALRDDRAMHVGRGGMPHEALPDKDYLVGQGCIRSAMYCLGGLAEAMIHSRIVAAHDQGLGEPYSASMANTLTRASTWAMCNKLERGMADRVTAAARLAIAQYRRDLIGIHSRMELRLGGEIQNPADYRPNQVQVLQAYPSVKGIPTPECPVRVTGVAKPTVADILKWGAWRTHTATDGSCVGDMVGQGLVIGIADWKCDDAEDPELGQARWEREPGTIAYASGSRLPSRWGAHYTTNNLAEGMSLADSMSVIPDQCRSLTYTDSLVWYDLTAKTRPTGEAGLAKVRLRAQWRSQVDRIRLAYGRTHRAQDHVRALRERALVDADQDALVRQNAETKFGGRWGGALGNGEQTLLRRVIDNVDEANRRFQRMYERQRRQWPATRGQQARTRVAPMGVSRGLIKIASHQGEDRVKAAARNEETLPLEPHMFGVRMNAAADTVANVMRKMDTVPADVMYPPPAGEGFNYSLRGRLWDGCARKMVQEVWAEELIKRHSTRPQVGAYARAVVRDHLREDTPVAPRDTDDRHDAPDTGTKILKDLEDLRRGRGPSHTLAVFTDKTYRYGCMHGRTPYVAGHTGHRGGQ